MDVTNPVNPRVVGAVPAPRSIWREVKVHSFLNKKTKKWDAYAYITTEASNAGLQIIDLSKLPQSVSLARVDREINTAHTAFVSNVDLATGAALDGLTPYLYLEGVDQSFLSSTQTPSLAPTSCGTDACAKDFPGSHCSCGSACFCSRNRGTPGFKVFSLANPRDPKMIGTYTETYMHDVYIETFKGDHAKQCASRTRSL